MLKNSATNSEDVAGSDHSDEDFSDFYFKELGTKELVSAAYEGLLNKVDPLIQSGHDVTSDVGRAALFGAAASGHAAVVKSLLEAGAPVDGCWGPYVETPLMKAAEGGHIKVVELLLAAGANTEVKDKDNYNAVDRAASIGAVDIILLLIRAGAKVVLNEPVYSPLYLAVQENRVEVVQELLAAGADPDIGKYEYKWHVDRSCRYHISSVLVKAAECGNVKVIELLLAAGTNIDSDTIFGQTGLSMAAANGHVEAVASLLKAGAHVNGAGAGSRQFYNPLIEASSAGHIEVVKLLLEAGADIEAVDRRINTALSRASAKGHLDVLHILLEAGAKVNSDKAIKTPLYLAVEKGHVEVLRELLAAGADPNSGKYSEFVRNEAFFRTWHKTTPLMEAAASASRDIVRILLDGGANASLGIQGGSTPLETAVSKTQDYEMIEMLLKAGADPFAIIGYQPPGSVRETVLDIAKTNEIRELLKHEMARRKAAALSVMPPQVPLPFKQEILRLAYSWKQT